VSRSSRQTGDDPQLSLEARFAARKPQPAAASVAAAQVPVPESPTAAPDPKPAVPRTYAVSDLVRAARLMLEGRFSDVRVEGEVSGFTRSGPGHIYFCLKDEVAQIDCVMWNRDARRLAFRVEDGLLARCRGRLTIYEGRGKFQLAVTEIEPAGAGALAVAFEQLKQKLAAEGLFDPARKRPIPYVPRRIAVVTSPTGAVIRDIVRVAHRRFPVPILLVPTVVQGEGASIRIAAALRAAAAVSDVDVIVLARGGGSLEDLWAFNEEPVARAIAACRVPVISAVGHETDFTIADFVADLRASTPSAAAEHAVPVADELRDELFVLHRRVVRAVEAQLHAGRLALERGQARLGDPRRLLDQRRQRLDDFAGRGAGALRRRLAGERTRLRDVELALYRGHPQRRIAHQRAALLTLARRLESAAAAAITRRRRALEAATGKLDALSPFKVLDRGYSLARGPDGHLVTRAGQVQPGDALRVTLRDGEIESRVERTRARPRPEAES